MGDANWFFSACAQTAGAIVAVVGGFLATRLITLGSERSGLRQAVVYAKRRLRDAENRVTKAGQELTDWEINGFTQDILCEVVQMEGDTDASKLIAKYGSRELPTGKLEATINNLRDRVSFAFSELHSVGEIIIQVEFDELMRRSGGYPSGLDRELYERVFYKIRNEVRKRTGSQSHPDFDALYFRRKPETAVEVAAQDRSRLRKAVDDAENERSVIQSELENLIAQLGRVRRPRGLVVAWSILAYICAVGVALPLALLPMDTEPGRLKWWVFGLFVVGLVALLAYFAKMFRTKAEDTNSRSENPQMDK